MTGNFLIDTPTYTDLITLNGITPGSSWVFQFASLPPSADFGIAGCGSGNTQALDSNSNPLTQAQVPCMPNLDSGSTIDTSLISNENDNAALNQIILTFGSGTPATWVFEVPATKSDGSSQYLPTIYQQTTAAPEPASLALLAAGLLGLGALRRKRAA